MCLVLFFRLRGEIEEWSLIVQPPKLLQQLGIIRSNEKWRVFCALYGMVESPADWANFRDGGLSVMTWNWKGVRYWLKKTAEQHLWRVCRESPNSDLGETAGWIAVYVDDFLVAMKQSEIDGAFGAIRSTWKCSDPEMTSTDKPMRFCGFEITRTRTGGFYVKQEGYIQDILDKYQITGEEVQPLPKIEDEEDEENPSVETIRAAQALVGELQWVTHRTRPDVSFAVGVLSRLLHRRPAWVVSAGKCTLRYLNKTKNAGLHYEAMDWSCGDRQELRIYADTSFAPPHEKYRSVHGILVEHGRNVIAWESGRQAFITQSTAEAELIGYNEAYQVGEAVGALMQVFEVNVSKKLMGDSKAAIAQLVGDTGPWRTRHLRLRSAKLREALQEQPGDWEVEHKKGGELVADGLTKSLQGSAFQRFFTMLRMASEPVGVKPSAAVKVARVIKKASCNSTTLIGACTVAAVALLKDDPIVASLLLVAVYALREVVGRAMKSQKDPAQDRIRTPQNSGGPGGTPYGFDRSGTVTQIGAGLGTPQVGGSRSHVDLAVGAVAAVALSTVQVERVKPGICALRLNGRRHGSESSSGSRRAVERGQAAMGFVDRPRGSASGAEETGVVTWSEAESVDSAGSNSGLEPIPDGVTLQSLLGDLRISDEPAVRENLHSANRQDHGQQASGNQQSAPAAASMVSQSMPAAASTVSQSALVAAGRSSQSVQGYATGTGRQEPEVQDAPWTLPRYQTIQRATKDKWDMTLWDQGWVIRAHHKDRVRAYHPIHETNPCDSSTFEPRRVTYKVSPGPEVVEDTWTIPVKWKGPSWRGYTFFRLKRTDGESMWILKALSYSDFRWRPRENGGVRVVNRQFMSWHAQIECVPVEPL